MENSKLTFILASASPRRKELVGFLKIPFKILAANIPEVSSAKDPKKYCLEISRLKGQAVVDQLSQDSSFDRHFVVASDTIVSLNGKIYGKPADVNEARVFLTELQGKTHSVFTSVTFFLSLSGKKWEHSFVEETQVTFNPIPSHLMELYLETGDSLDKAGAYGIQGPSLTFISKVQGDYANVVGFPLSRFTQEAEIFFKKHTNFEESWLNLF